MKNICKCLIISILTLSVISCAVVGDILSDAGKSSGALTQSEVAAGLRSALDVGIRNTVKSVSATDGFYRNSLIRIPFPQEAAKVKEICMKAGLGNSITQFEEKLNRAAEAASKEAVAVFVSSIKQMTITDAVAILKGSDNAATQYLRKTTDKQLYTKFYPIVKSANDRIMLAKYWTPLVEKYNKVAVVAGGKPVNTDLNDYVCDKALDGLFTMVAKEEKNIRKNASARVNDVLKKVFGSNLNPHNKQ